MAGFGRGHLRADAGHLAFAQGGAKIAPVGDATIRAARGAAPVDMMLAAARHRLAYLLAEAGWNEIRCLCRYKPPVEPRSRHPAPIWLSSGGGEDLDGATSGLRPGMRVSHVLVGNRSGRVDLNAPVAQQLPQRFHAFCRVSFKMSLTRHQGSALSPAFASDLGALIEQYQPELWIHGHDHGSHDYRIGRTRVFANQAGYPNLHGDRENPWFDPRCVIEVGGV